MEKSLLLVRPWSLRTILNFSAAGANRQRHGILMPLLLLVAETIASFRKDILKISSVQSYPQRNFKELLFSDK